MSKELTEKYYDCLLDDGFYYAKSNEDNNTFIVEEYPWDDKKYHNCEILAPVPSYEEYIVLKDFKRIEIEQIENLVNTHIFEQANLIADLRKKVHILNESCEKKYNELCAEIKENKKLKEQLKEANEVIKEFVKPEPFYILCLEEREKLPESNETKVAKHYLEKWGVK